MLQRAAETVSGDDECNDPAVLLACALGSTGCPAKCAEAEKETNEYNKYEGVQAGDLNVAVSTSSSVASIPTNGVIKVAELSLKASENIQLQSIDVTRLGLSENSGLKVWIEKDGRRITSSSSFFGDSKANLTFNNGGYVVNGDEKLDLVVSLGNGVQPGAELQFKLSNLVSSAKNSTISPDTTGMFRTAQYTVASISTSISATPANRNYDLSKDSSFSFGEFKLINNATASMEKDVMVKSITFKVSVNGWNIENLSSFKLLKDSKEISSKYTVDGKSVTFAVNDILESGKSATYKVTAVPTNIETTAGDIYTLKIDKAEDIIAEEIGTNATAFRVSVLSDNKVGTTFTPFATYYVAPTYANGFSLWETTIKGGNFTLSRDSNFASTVNADKGYSDVAIAKGSVKVNQSAKFEKGIKITAKTIAGETDLANVIRRATLKIGNRTYQASSIGGTANPNDIVFESEIYLEKGTQDVELQVSLQNSTNATKIEFNNIESTSFIGNWNYLNSDETSINPSQIAGSIKVSTVNIQEQKFTFKKTGPSEDVKFVEGNTDEKVLYVGEITNGQNDTLEVSNFKVWLTPTPTVYVKDGAGDRTAVAADKLWDVYISIIDWATSSTQPLTFADLYNSTLANDKSLSIDISSATVEPGKSIKFEVRFIPSANLRAHTDTTTFRVTVWAEGKLNGNTVSSARNNSATVKVMSKSAATISTQTAKSKMIVPGVDTEIASFDYKVKNDNMEVNTLWLKVGAGFTTSNVDNLTIDFGGNVGAPSLTWDSTATASAAGIAKVEFDNTVTIPASDSNYKVKVIAQFAESAASATALTIDAVAVNPLVDATTPANTFNFANAASATAATAAAEIAKTDWYGKLWNSHYVAKAIPVISARTNGDDLILTIESASDSKENMEILGFNIDGWKVVSVAFDEKTYASTDYATLTALNTSVKAQAVSLGAGDRTSLDLQASKGHTVKVVGVAVKIDNVVYRLDSDYTSVGSWSSFKVTAAWDTPSSAGQLMTVMDAADWAAYE